MSEEKTKSKYRYGDKHLHELNDEKMLEACETAFEMREKTIVELEIYRKLCTASFQRDKLWADFIFEVLKMCLFVVISGAFFYMVTK